MCHPLPAFVAAVRQAFEQANFAKAQQILTGILNTEPEQPEALYLQGLYWALQGQFKQARHFLSKALSANAAPQLDLLNDLGIVYAELQEYAAAITCFEQILNQTPEKVMVRFNLANALTQSGQAAQAQQHYQLLLQQHPGWSEAATHLALCLIEQKQYPAAWSILQQALRRQPQEALNWSGLAQIQRQQGQLHEAEATLQQGLHFCPHSLECLEALAALYHEQTRYAQACQLWQQALQHAAHKPSLYHGLALSLLEAQQAPQALELLNTLLSNHPEDAKAYLHRARAFSLLKQEQLAEADLKQHLKLQPRSAEGHYNLGNLYYRQQRFSEAISHLETACQLKPDFSDAWINLTLNLYELAAYPRALEAAHQAILQAPENPRAHIGYGDALLMCERFQEGFQEIEWRFQDKAYKTFSFPAPEWQGEDLNGKSLLVMSEQGIGDIIMFSRMVPWIQQRFPEARIFFRSRPEMRQLYDHWHWLAGFVEDRTPAPEATDYAVALMSLLRIFNVNPQHLPDQPPYLAVQPAHSTLQASLKTEKKLRVGLVWGSGEGLTQHKRSLPFTGLSSLVTQYPEVQFVACQKGSALQELTDHPQASQLLQLAPLLHTLADTGAALQALDLLISVDTSVAHLAGALNLPVWILLPFAPDWRWQARGQASGWYPSARLFRQPTPGDWPGLLEDLSKAFHQWLQTQTKPSF